MTTTRQIIRRAAAYALWPAMKVTGFRFSKLYRHEVTPFHAVVYRWVDTVGANHLAGI